MINENIFKAYDIRGLYPEELDEKTAYLLGKAYAEFVKPKKVVVGRDIREASKKLEEELVRGLTEQGVDVYRIGQITTDMLFFATGFYKFDGGIVASASHNPPGYAGFKVVREEAIPVTGNSGLMEIKKLVLRNNFEPNKEKGKVFEKEIFEDYKKFVLSFVSLKNLEPKKAVFNTLNGAMAPVISEILRALPIEITWLDKEVDPDLKKGEPNPLLAERRRETIKKIKESDVDFGVSWDGDGDRCFFFDENGDFIPAPFITSLLIDYLAESNPNLKAIADVRVVLPIKFTAEKNKINLLLSISGRTNLQEKLREKDAYMAAEMTAHYFFKDNYYSDNGIIPLLMVWEYLSKTGKKISELVKPLKEKFFMIDEIKMGVKNSEEVFEKLKQKFSDGEQSFEDGLTVEYPNWRFNIRLSNTEPVAKLNLEALSKELLEEKQKEVLSSIN